ncbi:hypothetical protein G1H11_24195 [Phytoactinopolyspora alkaliphila]|uniref:Uncharacterized protein n=1 Tax=Phytoactinopolyspora alkaliphila TaxID=1783498 RepID=A0A6N9YTN8_9ACTN|nr:DUF6703 family protein [Phytoactinopolyspora alkaliphila]NED98406.1 hypothetical protein [Phytoactinopolyspora alkaliphila]
MSKNRRQPRRTSQRRPTAPGSAQRAPRPGSSRRPAPAPVSRPGWRGNLERVSYPILLRLTRAPKWVLGAVTGGVLLGGLLAPAPWSPLLLTLVVLFLTWLLVLAWPKLQPTARILRGAVIGALAALLIAKLAGVM